MTHRTLRPIFLRLALPALLLAGVGSGAALLTLPTSASALPESATSCSGSLSADPSGQAVAEPDLTDYSFYCDGGVTAYSIVVDRLRSDGNNVDDYGPNPLVYVAGSNLGTLSPTESVNCGGATPSNGINCYVLNGSTAGYIAPGDSTVGSVDLTNPYCPYVPKGAKPGTPAVSRATVELIVTDSTGAEDGPFELRPAKACTAPPSVKAKVATRKVVSRARSAR